MIDSIKITSRWILLFFSLSVLLPYSSEAGDKFSNFSIAVSLIMALVAIDMLLLACHIKRSRRYLITEITLYSVATIVLVLRLVRGSAIVINAISTNELKLLGHGHMTLVFALLVTLVIAALMVVLYDAVRLYSSLSRSSTSMEQ